MSGKHNTSHSNPGQDRSAINRTAQAGIALPAVPPLQKLSPSTVLKETNPDIPAPALPVQGQSGTQIAMPVQPAGNHMGLPAQLKAGIENLSGYQDTLQAKSIAINGDQGPEQEANRMGSQQPASQALLKHTGASSPVLQGMFYEWNPEGETQEQQHIWHLGHVIHSMWSPKKQPDGEQEKYKGYGVWVRKFSLARLKNIYEAGEQVQEKMKHIENGLEKIEEVVGAKEELIRNVEEKVGNQEQIMKKLDLVHETTKRYVDELGFTLKKYAGFTVLGIGLGVGIAAIAEHFLSLPQVPMAVKASIDIAGILYGAFVSYRWMKTDLLPVLARTVLAGGNMAIWATTIYALLKEGLNGHWFSTVHVAALPLALTIEFVLRKIMAQVEESLFNNDAPSKNKVKGYGTIEV